MKQKKVMAMLVGLAMLVMAGCGNGNAPAVGTADTAPAAQESGVQESGGQQEEEATDAATQGDVVSLELVSADGVTLPDKADNFVEQGILDAIGVGVTLNIVGAGADYATALNARISGGDVPDLFQSPSDETLRQYVDNGIVMSLAGYLDQLQPFLDWVGEDALQPNYMDGEIYVIPKKGRGSYALPVVRQDWLDKVGAQTPTTMEEMLEVAKKLTFEDPDGNGAQDTYGFTGNGLGSFNLILNPYGGSIWNQLILEDGKLTSTLLAPHMQEGLEMCRKFVDAGVVDPDIVANTEDAVRDKMAQCKAGMAAFNWAGMYKQAFIEQLTAVDANADWVWFDVPDAGTGITPSFDTVSAVASKGRWCVSAEVAENPAKLDAVIKLLNFIVSEEGERLVSYGVEGRHYNIEDGQIVKTDLMSSECDFLWTYQIAHRDEETYLGVKFPEAADSIAFAAKLDEDRMVTYEGAVVAPEGFHAEDMGTYINENMIAFIFGTRPISEYDQFLEELRTTFEFDRYMESAEEQLREQGYME